MISLGTPNTATSTKLLLLGSGELGKEVAIEAQRLGVEVIAVDSYPNAPAMQVAHRAYVIPMTDAAELRRVIEEVSPALIVPEIEAIATDTLVELEKEGYHIIPTARATRITMDREGIRTLAAKTLGLKTSNYHFADSKEQCIKAVHDIGMPCVIKPVMSSSGKGQSTVTDTAQIAKAWQYAQDGARGGLSQRVIIEAFVPFDYEITLLTVRHVGGTSFCEPIGHLQKDGDYQQSWQPQPMAAEVLEQAQHIAAKVTEALGGYGLFGVELFIQGDDVYFSEVSPRPHDTGMVTMISQNLSEFALHTRAILGFPIPNIRQYGPAASAVILCQGNSNAPRFNHVAKALQAKDTDIRLFGKPSVHGQRRMGVALSLANSIEEARQKASHAANHIEAVLE